MMHQLPEQMDHINEMFFRLARSMDILTAEIATCFEGEAMYDEFHLLANADTRRKFACRIARLSKLHHNDHRLRYFSVEALENLERAYTFIVGGKFPRNVNLDLYKLHLDKAFKIASLLYDPAEAEFENPWDAPVDPLRTGHVRR